MSDSALMRSVLDSLLPPGSAWRLRPGGDFSHLLDGIADNLESVRDDVGGLGLLRDPYRTPYLEELERDFGIDPNTQLSDAQRRLNLAAVMFSRDRRGTLDDLQAALDRAGYGDGGLGFHVFANDPACDPSFFVAGDYQTMCGSATAYCGYSLSGLSVQPWTGIAWNGTIFCAVADGTAATSADGITWTAQSIGAGAWAAVCWNGTVFCAVGNGVCATSPDGATWTSRTISADDWRALCWDGTQFCCVGAGPTNHAATSPTGVTWTPQAGITAREWKSIAWNGTVFCCGGRYLDGSRGAIATSPTGVTWTNRAANNLDGRAIAWNGTVFCLTSNTGFFTSTTGTIWIPTPIPSATVYAITWAPSLNLFVAVGSGANQCLTSPTGTTWTKRGIAPGVWRALAWNGTTMLCAIGSGGVPEATSADALSWVPRQSGVQAFCGSTRGGGVYVVNGDVFVSAPAYLGCGNDIELCGYIASATNVTAVCGQYYSLGYAPVIWPSPADESVWPLIFFIAASATYDSNGYIVGFVNGACPQSMRQFLIELILRFKPMHTWAGLLVDFT